MDQVERNEFYEEMDEKLSELEEKIDKDYDYLSKLLEELN